jgi:hypothetical protein
MGSAAVELGHAPPPRIGRTVVVGCAWAAWWYTALGLLVSIFYDVHAVDAGPGVLVAHDGTWAFLADASCWGFCVAVAARVISGRLRSAGLSVSTPGVAGSVALAALPLLLIQGGAGLVLVLVLAATWLIRRSAIGRDERLRVPRSAATVVAVAGFATVASYVATHPLAAIGGGGGGSAEGTFGELQLSNKALAGLTIVSITGAVARVGEPGLDPSALPPAAGLHIPAHAARWVTFTHCTSRELRIRYRLYGRTWTEAVRPMTGTCPGGSP